MCIAIYKPAGAWATKRQLRTCFERNPDGAGYAWHDGTKVQLRKGFFTWRGFWKAFKRDVAAESPAFIHFRIATRGKHDAERCHPFQLQGGVLMHNGPCLNSRACSGDGDRSDSQQFAEDFVDGLTSQQFLRLKPMIEDFAGSEKIAAMFDDGQVVICNEAQGHWFQQIWWSNHSYESYGIPRAGRSLVYPGAVDDDAPDWWDFYDRGAPPARRIVTPYSGFAADEVWSNKLKLKIKQQLTIMDDVYKWDEAMHAYLMASVQDTAMVVPLEDEGVVYGPAVDGSGDYTEIGYIVNDSADYYDLYWMSREGSTTAATKKELIA